MKENIILFKDMIIRKNLTSVEARELLKKAVATPASQHILFSIKSDPVKSLLLGHGWSLAGTPRDLSQHFLLNPENFVIEMDHAFRKAS